MIDVSRMVQVMLTSYGLLPMLPMQLFQGPDPTRLGYSRNHECWPWKLKWTRWVLRGTP